MIAGPSQASKIPGAAIHASSLNHTYISGSSTVDILNNVSLTVENGQSVALIGRSGSGKSTLLNLVSGLEPIKDGDVHINGQSIKTLNDRDRTRLRGREIGFIYQAFNLIPTLTINDNITLPLALAGTSSADRKTRLQHMLDAVGLSGRGEDFPDRLSGGEQQRVAIARALIHQPPVILADEPTGNLDASSGRQVLSLLFDLVQQRNSALLMVTHSVEVAKNADCLLLLDQASLKELSLEQVQGSVAW